MKYLFLFLSATVLLSLSSCNDELAVSNPEIVDPGDPQVITGRNHFLNVTISDTIYAFNTVDVDIANGTFSNYLSPCGANDSMEYHSYFSKVADTTMNQIVTFGLRNCVPPNANGFRDSTYLVGEYPVEINKTNQVVAFITYTDQSGGFWASNLGKKGLGAQSGHQMIITSILANYQLDAVLDIEGSISGWVYNAQGDSLLISNGEFNSKAFSF